MDEDVLSRWLEAYEEAWETHDADAAAQLFTENAKYHQTPFKTYEGREAIRNYWARVTPTHEDITVTTELFGVANDQGFARFYAEYKNPDEVTSTPKGTSPEDVTIRLDGMCIITLQDTLCDRFREWWHREP